MFLKFKSKIGDWISHANHFFLRLIGKNLPTHTALKFLENNERYVVLDKSILLESEHMSYASKIYNEAMKKTGMEWGDNFSKKNRHSILYQLIQNVLVKDQGSSSVAECGCWRGQSAHIIARALKEQASHKLFLIFDSFEGLSEYSGEDKGTKPITKEQESQERKVFAASEELVRNNLSEFDFIRYYKGWIPDRFSEVKDHEFCFVNIDVDLYNPIKDCLEFFYPRMKPGGVLFLDDYGFQQFPGAIKAVDDFVKANKISIFIALPTGGAFIIK